MMNINTKTITMILTITVLVLCVAGIMMRLLIIKDVNKIQTFKSTLLQSDNDENLVTTKKMLEKYQRYNSSLESYLIDSTKNIEFIEKIEAIGERLDLELSVQNIKTEDMPEGISHKSLSMNVSAQGSWQSLMTLIILFENYPQNISIRELRLSGDVDSVTGRNTWNALFLIEGITT